MAPWHSRSQKRSNAAAFLKAIRNGDLPRVKQLLTADPNLMFAKDDYYGSPVRAATDLHHETADYLARQELQWLREGSVPAEDLYGALHDLGEAAHSTTGYQGSERFRDEAEPVVVHHLTHENPQIRYIAINVLSFHWNLKKYADRFAQMGLGDSAEEVRQIALSAMASLLEGTRDPRASGVLLMVLRDPAQSMWIQESAYHGLREIWEGFAAADRLWQQTLDREMNLRDAAIKRGDTGAEAELERQAEKLWEDSIDWEFVRFVEQQIQGDSRGGA